MQDSDLVLVCVFGKCKEQSDSAEYVSGKVCAWGLDEMRRGGQTEVDSCREVHLPPPPLLRGVKKLNGPGDKGLPQPVR